MTLRGAPGRGNAADDRLQGRHILVVDDEPAIRALVARVLRRSGATVIEKADAKAAWRHLLADPPDLLVSDVDMPRASGHELARRVRRRFDELPVLLVTGGDSAGPGAAQALLHKPFAPDDLVGAALALLGSRTALRPSGSRRNPPAR